MAGLVIRIAGRAGWDAGLKYSWTLLGAQSSCCSFAANNQGDLMHQCLCFASISGACTQL
jgi:hypothetical protein